MTSVKPVIATLLSLAALCSCLPLQQPKKLADNGEDKKSQMAQMAQPSEDELELSNLKQNKYGAGNKLFDLKSIPQAENMDNTLETIENDVPAMEPSLAINKATEGIRESSLDMTPKAVAEYLLITADFQGFDAAVGDLLSSNVITQQEAQTYKDAVGTEYENLLRKLVNAEEAYLEEYLSLAAARRVAAPVARRASNQAGAPKPQVQALDNKASDVNLALRKMQLRSLLEREATLDELLQVLVRDYLTTDMMANPAQNAPPNQAVALPTKAASALKKPLKPAQAQNMAQNMAQAMAQGTTMAPSAEPQGEAA